MKGLSFLDMQHNLSKRTFLKKPSRLFSKDQQNSGMLQVYQPTLDELRKVFNKFDSNKDGKISPDEYKGILKAMGKEIPVARIVKQIFEVADLDGDGFIDFNEFVEVQRKGGGVKAVELQSAFRSFDKDGDGKITVDEVFEVLRKLGEKCSMRDCRKMVKGVDANGDGVIDMDEFTAMMTRSLVLK